MNTHEEIAGLKRRIGGVEAELVDLKYRLGLLEARVTAEDGARAEKASAATVEGVAVADQASGGESPRGAGTTPPVVPTEVPPVLGQWVEAGAETQAGSESRPHRGNPLREWLEPLQLWPPSGEENAEVRLAAWWATRIGALLAVIGVVFLGIYVSREASPWVRLAEVGAVTAATIALGMWLERKLPKFGAVLFGAGLALAYFCAFAAYAVAPMKVIESATVATACELAVVAGVLAVAWWRGSQVVATMAVALGYVTAFLALRAGPAGFGPWVVLVLGVAAVMLRMARGWDAPSAVGMPLVWLYLGVAAVGRAGALTMPVGAAWFWAVLYFVLYVARDWVVALRGGELTRLDRVVQVTNSSLAVAVGLWVTAQAVAPRFMEFYFGASLAMLVATLAWWRVAAGRMLVPVLACKTAGLVALGVIAACEGHARSLVLLAQAFAMLVAARKSGVRGLRIATAIVGAVALGFFLGELRPERSPFLTSATLVEVVFLAAAAGFVAALQRWLGFDAAKTAFGAVVVGIAEIATTSTWQARGWAPAAQVGVALILAGVAAALRGWLPAAVMGAMGLLAAHVHVWGIERGAMTSRILWGNELALLVGATIAAGAIARWGHASGRRRANGFLAAMAGATLLAVCFKAFPVTAGLAIAAGLAVVFVGAATRATHWPLAALGAPLLALGFALFALEGGGGDERWLAVAAVFGWLAPVWLVAGGERLATIGSATWRAWAPAMHAGLATAATLLALFENFSGEARVVASAVAALAVFGLTWRPGLRPALEASWVLWLAVCAVVIDRGMGAASWVAFGASWAPAVALARWRGEGEGGNSGRRGEAVPSWAAGVQVTVAVLIGLCVAFDAEGAARLGSFGAVAAAAFAVWRWGGVRAARHAGLAVAAIGWSAAWILAATSRSAEWTVALGAVLATGAAVVALPFFVEPEMAAGARRWLRWLASGAGLALVFFAFARQRGEVADYATVGWGVAAVATFLAGLFGRSQPHRFVGLAGLALCVPRAFVVDLNSTLHRIAAFVALGVVLLWVGFSYHRFRHLIVDDEKKL